VSSMIRPGWLTARRSRRRSSSVEGGDVEVPRARREVAGVVAHQGDGGLGARGQGVAAGVDAVREAVRRIGREVADIARPATWAWAAGRWRSEGLVLGVEDEAPAVKSTRGRAPDAVEVDAIDARRGCVEHRGRPGRRLHCTCRSL